MYRNLTSIIFDHLPAGKVVSNHSDTESVRANTYSDFDTPLSTVVTLLVCTATVLLIKCNAGTVLLFLVPGDDAMAKNRCRDAYSENP